MSLALITASNCERTLSRNLLRSAAVVGAAVDVHIVRGHSSAGTAYNKALAGVDAEVVILAHQDVYLPPRWVAQVRESLAHIEQRNERWAVAGVWGVRPDGRFAGRVWCSGGNREHAAPWDGLACEVASLDEVVLVLNPRADLRFDEQLPGFHLYATDLILQARAKGYKSFVVDAPLVHNSRWNANPFDRYFFRAYRYMQKKWADSLPVQTCTVPITRWGFPLYRAWLRRQLRRQRADASKGLGPDGGRHPFPDEIARELGYESAQPT